MCAKSKLNLREWCESNDRFELIEQWDTDRNTQIGLSLDSATPGEDKKAYWKCPDHLDHLYDMRISQRTRQNQGCPYCSGKRVLVGFNDFGTKCEDARKEWDSDNNWDDKLKKNTTPADYTYGSHHIANFRCSLCKEPYSMMIKTFYRGNRCKYCAHIEVKPDGSNSFAAEYPDQLKYWDYEKNDRITTDKHPNGIRPENILSRSNLIVHWKCGMGHSWTISVDSQRSSPGCSKCKRTKKFSDSEKAVAYYVEKMFPGEVIDNHHPEWNKKQDLDIFIPSEMIAIQYDGSYKHTQARYEKDLKNGQQVVSHGIRLIRIRERDSPSIPDGSLEIRRNGTGRHTESLNNCIESLLNRLSEITGRNYDFTIDCDSDLSRIVDRAYTVELNNSISKIRPDLVPFIASNNEHPQNREVLSRLPVAHNGKIWWTCPRCTHDHHLAVHSVTRKPLEKFPCGLLDNKVVITGINDFATTNPEEMKDWDWVNNSANGINPKKIAAGSHIGPIYWVCHKPDCKCSWTTEHLYQRTGSQSHGCPRCNEKKRKDRGRNRYAKYTIQYLVIVRDNPGITAKEIQEKLGTTVTSTRTKLGHMVKMGELTCDRIQVGSGPKSCAYRIIENGLSILNTLNDEEISRLSQYDISKKAPQKNVNDLATWCITHNRTRLLEEWSSKNPTTPENHRASEDTQVLWECTLCKYVWAAPINSRTLAHHDCDKCFHRSRKVTELLCLRIARDNPGVFAKDLTREIGKNLQFISGKLKPKFCAC